MRKKDEITQPNTCLQTAHPEEMIFVLLGRDTAAPVAIRAWVAERIRLGKNVETDPQIVDALERARTMETEGRQWVGRSSRVELSAEDQAALDHGFAVLRRRNEPMDRKAIEVAFRLLSLVLGTSKEG
jgi:hypothetical protein